MISFLFSVVDKQVFWDKVYNTLSQKYEDFELLFAIHSQNSELEDLQNLAKQNQNVHIFTYEQTATENYMLNQTMKHVKGESLVLCRDGFVYATVLSDFLIEMGKQGAQIAMFQKQKKSNKIKKWFSNQCHKATKLLFGFDYYDGNIGLVYFGNIALSVLKELPNPSLLTKVNRWKGFEICYATAEDISNNFLQKSNRKSFVKMLASFFVLAAMVTALVVLCCFGLLGFLPILGFSTAIFLNLLWSIYAVAKFWLDKRVGDLK